MQRTPLSVRRDHLALEAIAESLQSSRYFRKINLKLLKEMMRQGELVDIQEEEHLILENEAKSPEIFVLLEGSLVVTSKDAFLVRLNTPGDVVGEMSIISGDRSHTADVIAETNSRVIAFPHSLFEVEENATQVPVSYLIFSHILSEKLRITSAQVMLGGNRREMEIAAPKAALVDEHPESLSHNLKLLKKHWEKAGVQSFSSIDEFLGSENTGTLDVLIFDPIRVHDVENRDDSPRTVVMECQAHAKEVLAVSRFCQTPENRKLLSQWGVTDFVSKPYTDFDLEHALINLRVSFYRQRELKKVEHDADTDRLTGLANRRRLDEFVEALITLYPEEKSPFSLIMCDVDHFKHYNDTHGHQMGDVVLASIAAILKNRVRRGDLAARFGGEEFVVILPKCGPENAFRIAEQLRKAVENENIPHQEQQPLGNLTSTFGVATFPDDASSAKRLLKKADDCLYQGKEAGRNVVISASSLK